MRNFDIIVTIHLFWSLFLFVGKRVVSSRFKSIVTQIMHQQVNKHVNINNKP